ncbi:C40 family peptidase [Actinomycetospora straminea]|uniref:C40 family peptidase n=1 Tax=Actinomycetospora straminea TaxID=663607 RepID=UPI0023668A4F|nr:NlpC/P60 family protein [Actinomycetospora straminea]MDD7931370.1 NlpC/P60 family protein [Actinomycetospora straminea]
MGVLGVVVGLVAGVLLVPFSGFAGDDDAAALPSADPAGFVFERIGPGVTEVRDQQDITVATLTEGARTVTLAGPLRVFAESGTRASVETGQWVRLAPQPWHASAQDETWARTWLSHALAERSPDILEIATQYVQGTPDQVDADGLRFAGDAAFGPELDNGKRQIGADFYDFLDRPWSFGDGTEKTPSAGQAGALDCSGFLRMVYGYRSGLPLLAGDTGEGLPRRADSMAHDGPGTLLLEDEGSRPLDLANLKPGDLLFFTTDDEPDIDHSAIYLGLDSDDRHRFISSRAGANGPTMGDFGGASVLDGDGFFAERFRMARRV